MKTSKINLSFEYTVYCTNKPLSYLKSQLAITPPNYVCPAIKQIFTLNFFSVSQVYRW